MLASSATGPGTITPAAVYVTGVYATNKVYDTTGTDPLNTGSIALSGVVSSDVANLSLSGTATGAFATAQVGVALPVSVSGLSIGGTAASNYLLQPITGLAASITPAPLTMTGVSANSKPYDGGAVATLTTAGEALVGLYTGDTVTVSPGAGTFTSVNVGNNLKVNASGFTINGAQASNYTLNQPTGLTANITQAPITADITGNPTKVYDGSASTTLTNANYTLLGFATVGGVTQGAAVPQSATASYAAPDAGTGVAIGSTLVLSDFVANSGTNLANYALPTVGAGTGTITQAPITVTLNGTPTKVYDSTTAATLNSANYGLTGFVGAQSATINQSSGTYASANAGSEPATAVLTGNYVAGTSTNLANYALPASVTGAGEITRASLTVTVSTTAQPYNGTTVDALTGATLSLVGIYSGDSPSLAAGTYSTGTLGSSGNAGTDTVTTAFGLTGTGSGNYIITQPSNLTAVIFPVQLSATATASKVYDGTTDANLGGTRTTVTGFVAGQGASVNSSGVTGTFASPDVNTGIVVTGGALVTGNLTANSGTRLANYLLPTSDNGTGTITLKALIFTAAPSSQQYGLFSSAGLTGQISGFITSESITSDELAGTMTGTPAWTTSATGSSNVGQYFIQGSGLTATNYSVTTQAAVNSTALTITPAPLTVAGVLTSSRIYNGSTIDGLSGAVISGVTYNNDALTLTNGASGTLGNGGNVGTDAVTTAMTLSGSGSGNYSLTQETGLSAVISAMALTATSSVTRSYTGTNVASLSGTNTVLSGFASGQGATVNAGVTGAFATTNVGTGIAITGGALSLGNLTANNGTVLSNYSLPTSDNGSGTITKAIVNLSGTRVYDGLLDANASIFGSAGTVNGVDGQNLILSGSGSMTAKNVISNGAMASSSGLTLGDGTGLASNYQLTGGTDMVTVTPLGITVNATGNNKVYDDNFTATVSLASTGVLSGDSLNFADTSATFATKNVANGVAVTVAGITESGAGSANYTVNGTATTSANITPLAITVNATGINKVYDGNVTAGVTLGSSGVLSGDSLSFADTSATFATKNVANGDAVTVSGITESGTGSGNYTVNGTATTSANITPLAILVNAAGLNKAYNGNVTAGVTLASSGVLTASGDSLSFADTAATFAGQNAANGVGMAVTGITDSGTGAANYTLINSTAATSANITPAIVNLAGSRTYDALLDATAGIFGTAGTVATGVGAETLALSGSGALVNKNAGAQGLSTLGTLALNDGTGLASNYQLTGGTDVVTVTPLAITVAASANNKSYDGTTAATLSALGSSGVIAGDTVIFTDTSASFNSKDVTAASTVTVAGIAGSGADSGNYTLSNSTAATSANITPAIVNLAGSRTYDALLDATAGIFGTAGTVATGVGAETLALSGSGALVNKNAGAQGLSTLGTLALNDGTGLASNYQLTGGTDVVTVTPLAITVAASANNKSYDGTTAATLSALGSSGVIAGDTVIFTDTSASFNSKDVTAASTVTVAGIAGSGADSGNYTLSNSTAATSANITPAIVNLAGSRTYDALLDATAGIFGTAGTVATGVGAETLALSGSGALVNKNAGAQGLSTLGTLALHNGTGLASNYQLTGGTDMVTVTPLAITVAASANNKSYDGTTAATLSALGSGGVIAGDTVIFTATGAAFADENAGNGKTVTISGITSMGADAGDYRFNASAETSADVTPATLTETAFPVSVAIGQVPNLSGTVSGFVPGDTRANATDGSLVWLSNATAAAAPGSYAIDGSGLTAANYVLVQSPLNATALTLTAVPEATAVTASVSGVVGSYLAPADIATPYGVGSANDYGNNTGNARRDTNPVHGNRHLSDFTGRLALTVIGAGIKLSPEAAH